MMEPVARPVVLAAIVALSLCMTRGAAHAGRTDNGVQVLGADDRQYGVEVDGIRPLVAGQIQLKGTYTLWRSGGRSGELVLGGNALFGRENDDGKQTELQAIIGYRQFVWRGLHAELAVLPGYVDHHSNIDGMDRTAFVGSAEVVAGYRWDIAWPTVTLYLLTDLGVGIIGINTDRWPVTSASDFQYREPYFAGNIAVGARF